MPPILKLRKGSERRVLQGHDWVYSNELETVSPPLRTQPGLLVHLHDYRHRFIAAAYYNPHTLIAARIVSRQPLEVLDRDWLLGRLEHALRFRQRLYPTPFYRWVHGEADGLPGLVVDRFGDFLTIQISTAGMDRLKPLIVELVQAISGCRGMVFRSDDHFRELEQLPIEPVQTAGDVPDKVVVCEGALSFETSLTEGQKTGWFYDQRDNRQRLSRYVRGAVVLDTFCYAGGWGITAAAHGAAAVTCLDSSAPALQLTEQNSRLNQVVVESIQADAFDGLRRLGESGRKFDVLVLDPPALIKRKRDHDAGLQAYYQLNRLAMRLLQPEGLLVSCSCSHHLALDELVHAVQHAARSHGRQAALAEIGHQSADHPIHLAMPESAYLKALFVRVWGE